MFSENEPSGGGRVSSISTVLLVNRECPWKCVFCDLWKNTLDVTVPLGAIPEQIHNALHELPESRWIKLYNAGSFFDPHAIPPEDFHAIVALLFSFERVIVESHPGLIHVRGGSRLLLFRDLLQSKALEALKCPVPHSESNEASVRILSAANQCSLEIQGHRPFSRLEVAMGLETVHPVALERLNKGMSLDDFARAADVLRTSDIDLRAFVLVQPPFTPPQESVHWALRSLDFAREHGARLVAFIPTRGGNGAMEALAASGDFIPPALATLEEVLDRALESTALHGSPIVIADLWDLERFSDCPNCFSARAARLRRMNLSQKFEDRILCECASTKRSGLRI